MNMDQKQHHGTPWWHQVVITGYIHLNQIYPPLLRTSPLEKAGWLKKAMW